jgi:DNA-binding transcriptional MocR family regulator
MKLYQQLADDLTTLIRAGALKPGDRVPSVRETSRERGMSAATVMHAYELLEGRGFIETRPRSGYYVGKQWQPAQQPRMALRLNYGHEWTAATEQAIQALGAIVRS